MNGKYLLDTNIVIALFAGEAGLGNSLATAEEVFLPSVAVGELYYGARKSGKPQENLARIDELVLKNVVLGCDSETARQYGAIKNSLRMKGRPLPENDIWIAALAIQHGLTLATRDAHFNEIGDLSLAAW
jgi:tRNA(fMet)-specific endonuclease VapC